jgi:hypothetical protein
MHLAAQTGTTSKAMYRTGWVITALIVLFMLFDGTVKILKIAAAMEGTAKLGYSTSVVFPLGIVALACTILYAIPRTSILGAILLTGYLGGAIATQVRVGSLSYLLPLLMGMLAWAGVYFRDEQLRALIPLRKVS